MNQAREFLVNQPRIDKARMTSGLFMCQKLQEVGQEKLNRKVKLCLCVCISVLVQRRYSEGKNNEIRTR